MVRVSYSERAHPDNNKKKPKITLEDLAKKYKASNLQYLVKDGSVEFPPESIDYDFKYLGIDQDTEKLKFALIFWIENENGWPIEKRTVEFSCAITDLPLCKEGEEAEQYQLVSSSSKVVKPIV